MEMKSAWNEFTMKMLLFFSVISLSCASTGSNGDEDLRKQASQIFSPLPGEMVSEQNPLTPEKIKLGKILFYETRISVDGTVSCARCHPFGLYAADGLKKAVGNQCKINVRNTPTVLNAAAQVSAHWIGNRVDVEDQARKSVTGPTSFGMPSNAEVEKILKGIPGYAPLFKKAFPADADPITVENFALAVGAFERTLVTPSPFDSFLAGNGNALNTQEKKGLKTFMDTGCAGCHAGVGVGGKEYQKFGILEPYWNYTRSETVDDGRFTATGIESDRYVFKIPMLRNVEMTAPYFHDGSVDSLEQAEWDMGKVQLGKELSPENQGDIHTFLKSLTGKIPEDVLTVPILP